MGIRVQIGEQKVPGTEPQKIDVTINVDNKGGGGGTFQADVNSTYPTDTFTYVANSASPMPDSTTAGQITWNNRTIQDSGTRFTYAVTCNSQGKNGVITAQACTAGSKTDCDSSSVSVSC